MPITKGIFGIMPEGQEITSYLLDRGNIRVEVLNYGAVIRSIWAPDKNGEVRDIVLGFEKPEDYFSNVPDFGAAVGRIVGPVPDLKLLVGEETVKLEPSNAEGVHIHGGRKGFTHSLWEVREFETTEAAVLELQYVSPDGEDGYPGTIWAGIRYALDDTGRLTVTYTGKSDRATPFNPTNHSYFNLSGHDSGTIKQHAVRLAHTLVMVNGVPTPVQDTPFDLRSLRVLGDALDSNDPLMSGGYDNFHIIGGSGFRTVLYAEEPISGRTLKIASDAAGTIFYSGNYLFDYMGKNGAIYGKSSGFACEPCHVQVENPFNPSHVQLLKPEAPYMSVTTYQFGVK